MSFQDELYMMRGMVASLPKEQQELIESAAGKIRTLAADLGEPGTLGIALVAMELAAASD